MNTTADTAPAAPLTVEDVRKRATLSVEEAAAVLGIGRSLAYEMARSGGIPSIRLGHRLLVPAQRLLDLLGERPD